MSTFDVVTIGGGLGASALAISLAKHGMKVLVLERETRVPRPRPRRSVSSLGRRGSERTRYRSAYSSILALEKFLGSRWGSARAICSRQRHSARRS